MEMNQITNARLARSAVFVARIFIALAFLALVGAWITQLTGGTLLGMNQQHLFNDTFALGVLGIAVFLDSLWHAKGI